MVFICVCIHTMYVCMYVLHVQYIVHTYIYICMYDVIYIYIYINMNAYIHTYITNIHVLLLCINIINVKKMDNTLYVVYHILCMALCDSLSLIEVLQT